MKSHKPIGPYGHVIIGAFLSVYIAYVYIVLFNTPYAEAAILGFVASFVIGAVVAIRRFRCKLVGYRRDAVNLLLGGSVPIAIALLGRIV